jgi:hypothetical protein
MMDDDPNPSSESYGRFFALIFVVSTLACFAAYALVKWM